MNSEGIELDLKEFPLSQSCLEELKNQMPFMWRSLVEYPDPSIQKRAPVLEAILQRLDDIHSENNEWKSQMVKSYVSLSIEFLKLQKQLEQSGSYLYSSEQEVFEKVYNSEDVFGGYYLEGLLLSQGLWPNHFKLNEAFKKKFLPQLGGKSKVLEIGVGTGLHQQWMMEACEGLDYWGVDLSSFAIDFSKQFSRIDESSTVSAHFDKISISKGLPYKENSFDHVVMGEVLEHIDDPLAALKELKRVTRPDGYFYMTTVIFTANIDHIYLFHDMNEIRDMCLQAGWQVEEKWVYPIYPEDTKEMRDKPMNVAMLLQKK